MTTDGDPTIVTGNWTTKALGTGNKDWIGLAYGAGKWIAIAKDGTTVTLQQIMVQHGLAGAAVTPAVLKNIST